MTESNFYTVYLYCTALNKGNHSVVEATNAVGAINKSLSMYPGYECWNVKKGDHSEKTLQEIGEMEITAEILSCAQESATAANYVESKADCS